MTSISTQGSTNITMQFDLDRNIDGAALDVQSAISASARRLPADLPNPPSFRKVNPADQPILFLVAHIEHAAAVDRQRLRRDGPAAADLADPRRRAGPDLRLAEIRRADPGRPVGAVRARARLRGPAHARSRPPTRTSPPGRCAASGSASRSRPPASCARASRLRRPDRLLAQRRPDPARRRRDGQGFRRERRDRQAGTTASAR